MKLIKGTHRAAHTGRVLKVMRSDKSLGFQVEGIMWNGTNLEKRIDGVCPAAFAIP